jgi:hypothetical protein
MHSMLESYYASLTDRVGFSLRIKVSYLLSSLYPNGSWFIARWAFSRFYCDDRICGLTWSLNY